MKGKETELRSSLVSGRVGRDGDTELPRAALPYTSHHSRLNNFPFALTPNVKERKILEEWSV